MTTLNHQPPVPSRLSPARPTITCYHFFLFIFISLLDLYLLKSYPGDCSFSAGMDWDVFKKKKRFEKKKVLKVCEPPFSTFVSFRLIAPPPFLQKSGLDHSHRNTQPAEGGREPPLCFSTQPSLSPFGGNALVHLEREGDSSVCRLEVEDRELRDCVLIVRPWLGRESGGFL